MFVFSNLLVTVGDMKVAAETETSAPKHFFVLLLFVSLYLLYYCNYYLLLPRLNVSFIDTDEISCGQFKRG